jgi:hypothetical protein
MGSTFFYFRLGPFGPIEYRATPNNNNNNYSAHLAWNDNSSRTALLGLHDGAQ